MTDYHAGDICTYPHGTGNHSFAVVEFLTREALSEALGQYGLAAERGKILAELDRSKVSLELRLSPRKHLILDWVGFGVGRRYTVRLRRCFFQDI